ncbi:hypothetical protein ACSBR1_013290 [Camellia fascicularis]
MLGHHIIMDSKVGPYVWLTHEEVYDAALQICSGWSILENGAVYMDPISQNGSFQWRYAVLCFSSCRKKVNCFGGYFEHLQARNAGYVTKVNLNFNHHQPLVCSAGVTDANSVEFIINHPEVLIPFVQENKIDTGYANMPSKVYFTSKNYCQLWEISSMQKKEAEDLGVSCFSWKEFALLGSLDRKFPQSDICMMMMYASGTTEERKGVVLTNGMIMAEACLQINCYLKQRKW